MSRGHVGVERPARRRRRRERHDELASRADASGYDHRHKTLPKRLRAAELKVLWGPSVKELTPAAMAERMRTEFILPFWEINL